MDSPGVLELDLAPQFGRSEKKQGASFCYDFDCVRDVNILNNRISGVVYGSQGYEVELYYSVKSGAMKVTGFECACPHFARGFNCKHIWALILECDYLASHDPRWKKFLSGGADGDQLDQLLAQVSQRSRALTASPVHADFLFGTAKKQQEKLAYVFDISEDGGCMKLLLYKQKQKKNGELGAPTRFKYEKEDLFKAPAESRQLLRALTGYEKKPASGSYSYYYDERAGKYESFDVSVEWSDELWQMLAKTERTFWSLDPDGGFEAWRPVAIDVQRPYTLELKYDEKLKTKTKVLVEINNGEDRIENDQVVKAGTDGMGLSEDRLFKIANPELFPLLECVLRDELVIKKKDRTKFVELLDRIPNADRLPLPESWEIDRAETEPVVGVEFYQGTRSRHVWARVFFEYGSETFPGAHTSRLGLMGARNR